MKVFVVLALCLLVAACNDGGAPSGAARGKIANRKDSLSYFFGTSIGNSMRRDSLDMNADMIYAGVRDALGGDTTVLADSGYKRLVEAFSSEMQAKAMARQQREAMEAQMKDSIAGLKNKSEGEAYLAANKAKPDVVTLPSGLQYKVIKEGTGPMPKATDQVEVLYRGTLINGKVFDSSGVTPATFGVNQVVPGWSEALQKMKVGSKWQLVLPAALAYGPQSPGGEIGPNAVLLFDVELVKIVPPQAGGQQGMPQGMQSMPGGPGSPGHP
jgi:FKBP-type peptidyl-prolyl cis-trans isomerase